MSPAEVLKAAHAAGIELRLDGGDLVLEASAPPPDGVLDALSRHKPAARAGRLVSRGLASFLRRARWHCRV